MSFQDKITVTKSFNALFMQFMDDVLAFLPNDNELKRDVKQARQYFELLRNMNPSLIIKVWYSQVYMPYQKEIHSNDIVQFILKKNYENDLSLLGNAKEVIEIVDKLKGPIGSMTEEQKQLMMDYLRKLSFLSLQYSA